MLVLKANANPQSQGSGQQGLVLPLKPLSIWVEESRTLKESAC